MKIIFILLGLRVLFGGKSLQETFHSAQLFLEFWSLIIIFFSDFKLAFGALSK